MASETDSFPVLGEPLAVELALRRVVAGDARRLDQRQLDAVRPLRNAVREILRTGSGGGSAVPVAALAVLNRCCARTPCRYRLDWSADGGPASIVVPGGRGFDRVITFLAIECASFISGPDLGLVRRCEGRGCPMYFVQGHHRRRFCHHSCAHRARQARYYRNRRPDLTRPAPTQGATS